MDTEAVEDLRAVGCGASAVSNIYRAPLQRKRQPGMMRHPLTWNTWKGDRRTLRIGEVHMLRAFYLYLGIEHEMAHLGEGENSNRMTTLFVAEDWLQGNIMRCGVSGAKTTSIRFSVPY